MDPNKATDLAGKLGRYVINQAQNIRYWPSDDGVTEMATITLKSKEALDIALKASAQLKDTKVFPVLVFKRKGHAISGRVISVSEKVQGCILALEDAEVPKMEATAINMNEGFGIDLSSELSSLNVEPVKPVDVKPEAPEVVVQQQKIDELIPNEVESLLEV